MTSEIVIRIEKLRKNFGAVHAVEEVDLEVRHGSVFGFLGPNGAGKTTTIGMILSLIHPTAGTVTVLGEPVSPARNRVLRRVGAMAGAPVMIVIDSMQELYIASGEGKHGETTRAVLPFRLRAQKTSPVLRRGFFMRAGAHSINCHSSRSPPAVLAEPRTSGAGSGELFHPRYTHPPQPDC